MNIHLEIMRLDSTGNGIADAEDRLPSLWTEALDPLFWPAARVGVESAWITHVPFAHWLVTVHRPRSVVELGTHNGVSYAAFCEAVQRSKIECRCFAVDTWRGDEHAGFYGPEIYDELRRFHDARYAGFSELLRCTFDEALDYIADGSVDLLHIDGLHTYDAVRHDFEQWKPKLSDRAVVLFHDTNVRERKFGVWRIWDELSHQYPSFEFLHGHGLGLLAVGRSCGAAITGLSHLSESATNTVRERFSFLGERWRCDMQAQLDRTTRAAEASSVQAGTDRQNAESDRLRADVDRLKVDLARAATETAALATQAASDREMARTDREMARTDREMARTEIETRKRAEQALADAYRDISEVNGHRAAAEAMLAAIQASTAWRVTWPARAIAARMPRSVRRAMRGAAYITWWTITLQLPQKLRRRTAVRTPITASPAVVGERPRPQSRRLLPARALPAQAPHAQALVRNEPVDIVICVHNALESVQACIESVLRCTLPSYRVIIIDDCSDTPTAQYLEQQARQQNFLLHRNTEATGYTLAANTGLRAATAHWVVLLNSDTIVTPGWLDRMWAHGARNPSVGVIGPLSNTASWQSVPRVFHGDDWSNNRLPPELSVEEMGELVAGQTIGTVALPFINGFCYMIRRDVLKSIGIFDEVIFAAGYGEENDYCIRVRNAGWELVVATDTYVYHAQSMSYSHDDRLRLAKKADEVLAQKHDPRRDIWPQASLCRDSLAMASMRGRVEGALQRRTLVKQGRRMFEGKRVAFILPVAERGGGGNVVLQESVALQRMGVDVTLLNLEESQLAMGPIPELDTLVVRTFPSHEALTAHLSLEQRRYDAVIATLYSSVYWLPLWAKFRLGYYIQDFEPYFFAEDDPRYTVAMDSYRLFSDVQLITKTLWNQMEVQRHTARHAVVVGPSVEASAFAPDPNRGDSEVVRIVAMVRPPTPRRAPERTIAVLERAVAALGDRVSVDIFGATEHELREAGLSRPWATSAGRLDQAALAALLSRSDIFLDCSDYQAMGLTALEAMLSGCAVIGPERGGANSFIRTGVNGLLLNTADEAACVATLVRLVNDPVLLTTIRIRAVEDANLYIPERAALGLMTALFDA